VARGPGGFPEQDHSPNPHDLASVVVAEQARLAHVPRSASVK
jgi:hypothetical protein